MITCKTCQYFVKATPEATEGECRFHPPEIQGFSWSPQIGLKLAHAYPTWTQDQPGCGQHQVVK